MKAMILAAGLGTRLRPLTQAMPKALLLVNDQPLIAYSLKLLRKNGVEEVLINLHHLGELIEKELGDGSLYGMKISYSWEPTILGTGGGIKKGASFFGKEAFFVLNSDILIDLNLRELFRFHRKKKGIATMVVRPLEAESSFTPLFLGRGNRILKIGEGPPPEKAARVLFTGAQVLEPRLLSSLPEGRESCIIRNGYQPALALGEKVYGHRYEGYWNDLGTLESYRQTESDLASGRVRLSFL